MILWYRGMIYDAKSSAINKYSGPGFSPTELRLIGRITSSVQASFILQCVLSLGTRSQISLKELDVTNV